MKSTPINFPLCGIVQLFLPSFSTPTLTKFHYKHHLARALVFLLATSYNSPELIELRHRVRVEFYFGFVLGVFIRNVLFSEALFADVFLRRTRNQEVLPEENLQLHLQLF